MLVMPRNRVLSLSAMLVAATIASAHPSAAATSGTVVGVNVPSAITLADQCGTRAARQFGAVLPGSAATTTTGASVCRYTFASSNSSSMLRLYQADTTGAAMVGQPSAWTTASGAASVPFYNLAGFGTSSIYGTADTSSTGTYRWSTDGGATWRTDSPDSGNFGLVSVPSSTVAWRIGSAGARRSNDANSNPGPPTWSAVTRDIVGPPTQWSNVTAVDAVDYNTAWIVSGANALRTTNPVAAEPWEQNGTGCSSPNAIDAFDASTAFVTGTGEVCRTTNGGTTWTQHSTGLPAGVEFNDVTISPQTSTTVWVGGADGAAYRSTDNGATWSVVTLPLPVTVHRISMLSDNDVYVGAEDGLLWRTINGGASWTRIRTRTTGDLGELYVGSSSVLLHGGASSANWQTVDGGTSWTDPSGPSPDTLVDVDAVDDDVIVAARGDGKVRVTTDGGSTWTDRATGLAPDNVRGVALVDGRTFIAVGDRGAIAVTDDAGLTWTTRASGTVEDLWDVDVEPGGVAAAVGAGGTILRSTDFGWNWSVRSSSGNDLRRVAVRSGGVALAAGLSGTLRRSGDGGATWTTPASGTTANLVDVELGSPTVAYASGRGVLRKSTDGGVTWSASPVPGTSFAHLAAVNEDVVWMTKDYVGGSTQWASRSTDGGLTWTGPFGNGSPDVRSATAIDGGRVLFTGRHDWVRITTAPAGIADYGGGATWATGGMFGGCLQDIGGAATAATWTEDASGTPGQCEAADTDPWYAIPTAPVKIAQMASSGTGSVDLVWGVRTTGGQAPGSYTAGIVVEALAPNA